MLPGNEWLWTAFSRLGTTRSGGAGGGPSPISYLEMVRYAREFNYSVDARDFLWDVIKKLDQHFSKRMSDKLKPKGGKKP